MKKLTQSTFIGQQGINLIERRIQSMGFWWYPSSVAEVGIDGILEIRDSETGRMTNLILQVQSKATERPWAHETQSSFEYLCEEEDLQYWLAGTAPVVLIMSRPSAEEAYWVSIKDYFKAHPEYRLARRIVVDKDHSRFDASAADALMRLAAPEESGVYLSPRPRDERLVSNLLKVRTYAPDLYIAETEYRDTRNVWRAVKELGAEIGPEWFLANGNLHSFHDISEYPWNKLCDVGTFGTYGTKEWAVSDDCDRVRQFVRILNLALRERLREWNVWQRKSDHMFYFGLPEDRRTRRVDFAGAGNEQFRTVVQRYATGKFHYYRHLGFNGFFKRFADEWYLEITPSYVFTADGRKTPYRFEADMLQGIKQIEHNDTLLAHLHLWTDVLKRGADLVHKEYLFLSFSELLTLDLSYGINDKEWLFHEEIDVAQDALESLSALPLIAL